MSEREKQEARAAAAAAALVYPYPCGACGAPAGYELLPVAEDGLGLPSYWCRACWGRAFRRAGGDPEGAAALLREQGTLRELSVPREPGEPPGVAEFRGSPRAGPGTRGAGGRGGRAVTPPRWEAPFFGAVALASGGFLLWLLLLADRPAAGGASAPALGALAVWAVLFAVLAARRWRRGGGGGS